MLTNKNRIICIIISIAGCIWAWMVHSSNLKYYQQQTDSAQVEMILTADDASYIVPAYNFYQRAIWKDNSEGVSAYVQRPPMIGMIHYVFLNLQLESTSQKYVAILLHGLAIFLLGLMSIEMFGKTTGIIIQLMYAILPVFWGYLFYYLSESITPSLVVFLLYVYFKFHLKNSPKWLLWQGFIVGILLLTRPQLAVLILPFLFNLWVYIRNRFRNRYLTTLLSVLLAFGVFILWQIRSVVIATEFVGIHPIYHITNNSQYRPVHHSFGNMFRIWEHDSKKFHSVMTPFWTESMSREEAVNNALNNIPQKVYRIIPRDEFQSLFADYDSCLWMARSTLWPATGERLMLPEGGLEKKVHLKADSITRILRKKMWVDNLLITPSHSIYWMFTKSQLNLLIFQKKYRGQWWMEGFRYFCVILICAITLLALSHLGNIQHRLFFLIAISVTIYLFYLFFIQRMNEERYFIPLLPILLILAVERIKAVIKKLTNRNHASL